MNEEPKSIWKKPWKGPRGLLLWFALLGCAAFVVVFLLGLAFSGLHGPRDVLGFTVYDLIISVCLALMGIAIVSFIHWIRHWRNLRRFLFGLVCFATLVALLYAEENWRGKHDWGKYKREWEAKGERFDTAGLAPPPVPDAQNFAMSPVWVAEIRYLFQTAPKRAEAWYGDRIYSPDVSNIFTLLPVSVSGLAGTNWAYRLPPTPEVTSGWPMARMINLQPWQSYYRDLETTNREAEIPITPQPQTPGQDVLLALSKFDPVIEQLRQDSARPYSRFPLEYNKDDPAAIMLPHLATVKRYAQVLQLRAIAELQNNQSDKSLADIELMLRLSDSIRTEPFLITHLVRLAIVNLALQPIWEGLAEHKWSDAQLAELDSRLAELDFLADYKLSMRGERDCDTGVIEFLRHRNFRNFKEIFGLFGENDRTQTSLSALLYYWCPNGWFYQNELTISRFYDAWYLRLADETNRTVSPAAARAVDDAVERELSHRTPENFFEKWVLPALGNAVKKFAYGQESVDLARVAMALERYHLAHGSYPQSLDALVPQFIAQLPHDLINDQPLHYRRTADGQFVLYSVGWNETDDGGVVGYAEKSSPREESPSRVDLNQGDWVWRSSAVKD